MSGDHDRHLQHTTQEERASHSEIADAPHGVVASVDGTQSARALIEDLEDHGIPSGAIELLGARAKDTERGGTQTQVAESRAFSDLARSSTLGGAIGTLFGGLLGLLMALIIADLTWPWGLVIGGAFGVLIGGAVGGMSVAKYASPAWDETFQVEDRPGLEVAAHHASADVVDEAESVMARHVDGGVRRL